MYRRGMGALPGSGWRNPFADLERMRNQIDMLSDLILQRWPSRLSCSCGVFPSINLTENRDTYFVRAELPGLKAKDLNIQVVGRSLTISGERSIPSEGENCTYHRREREAVKFSRAIALPGDIEPDCVEAQVVNGLLTVIIPKSEAAKPKQISVN